MKGRIMNGEVHSIKITEGTIAFLHGFHRNILEVYIPEHNISFNAEGGGNCFYTSEQRYSHATKIADIDIPDDIVEHLVNYLSNAKLDKPIKWFEGIKEKYNE
jgi:hypothetical protein